MAKIEIKDEEEEEDSDVEFEDDDKPIVSEKERLMRLYEELKKLKVNSLGDLENLIAKAE